MLQQAYLNAPASLPECSSKLTWMLQQAYLNAPASLHLAQSSLWHLSQPTTLHQAHSPLWHLSHPTTLHLAQSPHWHLSHPTTLHQHPFPSPRRGGVRGGVYLLLPQASPPKGEDGRGLDLGVVSISCYYKPLLQRGRMGGGFFLRSGRCEGTLLIYTTPPAIF